MEEKPNSRAHLRMDVAILLQHRKLTPAECEDIETIISSKEETDLSPLSFSLRPFMEGEGKEEEMGSIDPFILNALIDINLKLNLIISTMSSREKKNILTRIPIEVNLSEGGIGFITKEEVCDGDLLEVEMILPVFPIAFICRVGGACRARATASPWLPALRLSAVAAMRTRALPFARMGGPGDASGVVRWCL